LLDDGRRRVELVAHAATRAWVGIGILLLSLGLAASLRFLRKVQTRVELGVADDQARLEALLGVFLIVEAIHGKKPPLVADEVVALVGIVRVLVPAPFLVQAAAKRLLKR
jgi:hypothetical protein